MKGPATRLEQLETAFEGEIATLQSNMPPVMSQVQREAIPNLRKLWTKFVEVTDEVTTLGLANSNNIAIEYWENSGAFWDDIDARIENVVSIVRKDKDPDIAEWAITLRGARTNLQAFRNSMVKFITDPNTERRKGHETRSLALVGDMDEQLARATKNIPQDRGGREISSVLADLQDKGVKTIEYVRP
jgi:hypothetical protein